MLMASSVPEDRHIRQISSANPQTFTAPHFWLALPPAIFADEYALHQVGVFIVTPVVFRMMTSDDTGADVLLARAGPTKDAGCVLIAESAKTLTLCIE